MPTVKWPAIFVSIAALAASAVTPVVAHAATDPSAALVRPAPLAAPPAAIALAAGDGLRTAPLAAAAGPTVDVAGYYGPRRAYRGRPVRRWSRRPVPRRYVYRPPVRVVRPPVRVYRPPVRVYRPPVRFVRPWTGAWVAPIAPCSTRVVVVRRNGRLVRSVVRCSPVIYGPTFYGGRYVRF